LLILETLSSSQIAGGNSEFEESFAKGSRWLGREYNSTRLIEELFSLPLIIAQEL